MNWKSKKHWIFIGLVAIILLLSSNHLIQASNSKNEIKRLERKIDNRQETIQKRDAKISKLEDIVTEAEPWFDLTKKEQQRKIDKEEALTKEEKEAEEKEAAKEEQKKAKAEAKAEKEAEEEEKKGYETDITYDQLARNPDDYIGEKVQFHGKVVQVMEDDDIQQIRFAVDDDYDNMMYAEYDSDIVDSRILEDDMITILAISSGLLTYESTMGGNITIPSVFIDKIEQ